MHIYFYIFTSCCNGVDVALNYKHANRVSFYVPLETKTHRYTNTYTKDKSASLCRLWISTFVVLPLYKNIQKIIYALFSPVSDIDWLHLAFLHISMRISIWIGTRRWLNMRQLSCLAILIANLFNNRLHLTRNSNKYHTWRIRNKNENSLSYYLYLILTSLVYGPLFITYHNRV